MEKEKAKVIEGDCQNARRFCWLDIGRWEYVARRDKTDLILGFAAYRSYRLASLQLPHSQDGETLLQPYAWHGRAWHAIAVSS